MGRSVDYLANAARVSYFDWPTLETGSDDDYEVEYEDSRDVVEDIQQTIMNDFPEFSQCDKWDGRETHIVLEGYGTEIGLSEYCGLATLSIRVDENWADLCDSEEYDTEHQRIQDWINQNWEEISKYWNRYRKVGTFSNGEGVYETVK